MENPRYTCPIPNCQETRVCKDFLKHFLRHSNEETLGVIGSAPLKSGVNTGKLVILETLISGKKKTLNCCFGCEKLFARESLFMKHTSGCKKKAQHKLKCKSILESNKEVEPEPEWVTAMKNMIEQIPDTKGFLELNYPDIYKLL
jgi:hypothetical protein